MAVGMLAGWPTGEMGWDAGEIGVGCQTKGHPIDAK